MKKEYIYAAIAIAFWSTLAANAKLLLGALNNMQLLCLGSLFSGIALLIVCVISGKLKLFAGYKLKDVIIMALIGLPGTFLYYVFYYAGADILPASQAFIINYMWPIMSIVFACIILKEKLTVRKGIAILISFAGVAIVTGGELLNFNINMITGASLCLVGAVSYGLFTALNQKMNYDKCISMMINSFVAFVLSGVVLALKNELFIPVPEQIPGIIWNGVFTMAVANTMWTMSLESGKTAKISNLAYITPFLSLVWTFLILKEKIRLTSVIGLVVIIAGILIQLKNKKDTL